MFDQTISFRVISNFQVYVINLARRPERRRRMSTMLDELGFNYTIFTAVDGRYMYIYNHTVHTIAHSYNCIEV